MKKIIFFIVLLLISGGIVKAQIASFNCNQTPRKVSAPATTLGSNVASGIAFANTAALGHPFTTSSGTALISGVNAVKDTAKKVEFAAVLATGYQAKPTSLAFSLLPSSGGPTKVELWSYSGSWTKVDSTIGITANGSTTTAITLNFPSGTVSSRCKVVLYNGSPAGGTGTIDNFVWAGSTECIPVTGAIASSNSPILVGNSINLSSSATTGGLSYSWSGPNGFTSSTQNPSIASATAAMAGTYTVTVTSAGSCSATATTAVTVTSPCGNATYTNTTLGPITGVQKNLLVTINNTSVTGVTMIGQSFEITPGTGKSELLPTSGSVTLTASTTPCN
jgi:hypothetical protein